MEQSQTHRTEDNVSQSSKKKYTKFVPKEVSETGSKKKLSLEGSSTNLKNLVRTSNRSSSKEHMKNEQSAPNLLMRVGSQVSFTPKAMDSSQGFKPPLPHKVRFCEDIPAQNNRSQFVEKGVVRNLEVSISGTLNSFVQSSKPLPTDLRTEEFYNNHLHGLPIGRADQRLEAKQKFLLTEIQRYRLMKEAYFTKLTQVKELYTDLSHMVKDSLAKYHLEMDTMIKTFKVKFERQLQLLQQAKALRNTNRDNYFIPPPKTPRAPMAENISNNLAGLSAASGLESFKNDGGNSIFGKLQKIRGKLDEMSRLRQEFSEEQTANSITSLNTQFPRRDSGPRFTKNVGLRIGEEWDLTERAAIRGKLN